MNMTNRNTRLVDLNNDLKVNQLLGNSYSKGLDDTEVSDDIKQVKEAEKRRTKKYSERSSRLLGAFDRSEPVLYPSTLSEFITIEDNIITIDTEKYFTKLFRLEGYGKIGTETFQFNSVLGNKLSAKDSVEGRKKTEEEEYKETMDREIAEGMESGEDDAEGITQTEKMLTKAFTGSPNTLAALKILEGGKYVLNVFGTEKSFDSEDKEDNVDDLYDALQEINIPTKTEILEILRSQKKSVLKNAILGLLTPQENKIGIGKATISLDLRTWETHEKFVKWILRGGGQEENKKEQEISKNMAKGVMAIKEQLDVLEKDWGDYVHSKQEAPYDKFISMLQSKKRKDLIKLFNNLIVNVKQDKYNLSNPKQSETAYLEMPNTLDEQYYEFFVGEKPNRKIPRKLAVEGKKKLIGLEETAYDKDGKPKKDKDGKVITEIKPYYPAFGSHDKLLRILAIILKELNSSNFREGVMIIPLMEYADTETSLLEEIKEQLLNSKDWNVSSETDKEGNISSTEWKTADTSGIKILRFNSDNNINTTVDTKLGGRTNSAFRGRFGASRVQAP